MKVKPTHGNGGVTVELGPEEQQIPEQALKSAMVFKIQRILVPVDFSDCSAKALQYAVPFSKQFGAELVLLHVVQPYPAVPEIVPLEVETVQDSRQQLDKLRASLGEAVRASVSLGTGDPALEITHAARELAADLIIISTHGHKGLTRMLLGSTTEKVVRRAPCPVLIVRETEREFIGQEPSLPVFEN